MSLDNIRVVLVETSHPGNIGATARAMKTMGLGHLRLVPWGMGEPRRWAGCPRGPGDAIPGS